MEPTIQDLKNASEVQDWFQSLPRDFNVIPGFEAEHCILMTVSVPDVLPGATVNIK